MWLVFYEPKHGHGLKHNPFNAIVIPRPIGWISTQDGAGQVNLAPFSFFNAVAYVPPMVMFATTGAHPQGDEHYKDSMRNAVETGEFVVNIVTWKLREQMNLTSAPAPAGVDEFDVAGLEKAVSRLVAPPRVAAGPVHLECRTITHVELPTRDAGDPNTVVFGEVIGVHIADELFVDGLVDPLQLQPIARLGYRGDYTVVRERFEMIRPDWPVGSAGNA